MLSYVEHYEPSYFLLENVVGFLAHKFYADRETAGGTVETVIQAGMVKLVVRTLICARVPGALQGATGRAVRRAAEPPAGDLLGREAWGPAA